MVGKIAGTIAGLTLGASVLTGQTIDVNGKLNSLPDNVPLKNAVVKFYDASDTTNMLGEYSTDSNGEFFSTLTDVEDNQGIEVSSQLQAYLSAKGTGTLTFNINNPEKTNIDAKIYSAALGEEIAKLEPTDNEITWDKKNEFGQTVANGVYVLTATNGKETITGKILVLDNYMTVGPKLLLDNQTILPNKKLSKNMSTIQNVLMKVFSQGHEAYDTTFSGTENHTLDIDVWKTANYKLDFIINTFNTAGERIKDTKLLEAKYANGELDTLTSDTEGIIKLVKRFYSELNDKEIQLTQINSNFLGWQTYLTTNKDKLEHITQNWNPADAVVLEGDEANAQKAIEIYVIPKRVQLPNGNYINMDSDTVKTMIGQTTHIPQNYTSKPMPSQASQITDINLNTFELVDKYPINQDSLSKVDIHIREILSNLTLPEHKILLQHNYFTINSFSDQRYINLIARNFDNSLEIRFHQNIRTPETFSFTEEFDTTSKRIYSGTAEFDELAKPLERAGAIFNLFTNTQHPFEILNVEPPAGRIEEYVFTKEEKISEFGKHIIGINYLFFPGTEY